MKAIKAFFLLIRYPNILIIALTQFFFCYFIIEANSDSSLWFLILSTCLVASAGNMINDYFDVKIDNINKPKEIVVGRVFDRRLIIVFHFILNFVAFLMAFSVSYYLLIINIGASILLWLYSQKLKCVPLIGNILVSVLIALVVLSCGVVFGFYSNVLFGYAIGAFLINLIREITKDVQDLKGDSAFDCKTLPLVIGVSHTKKILLSLTLLFIIGIIGVAFYSELKLKLFLYFVITPLNLILIFLLNKASNKTDYKFISRLEKLIILCGVISMVFL